VKVRAILNPRAGVGAQRTRDAVERGRPGWSDFAVYLTRAPGHATELAREAVASGADVVVAVGGDGTVNEVARAVIGTSAALGIVPVGSGNGLARALRLPLQPARALEALERGELRAMDVGRLNGRPFLNVAGVGFDAAVGRAFHERGRRGGRRGLLGYVHLSVRELVAYRPTPLELECGGERLEIAPFVVTVANGPQYGSGAVVNPGARLDDGRFELVVFDHAPLPRLLLAASRMFAGGVERMPGYRRLSGTVATITSREPLAVHVDGDPVAPATRVDVELAPLALQVVVPAGVAADPAGPFTPRPPRRPRAAA
jgi:YegS/Rv2252/BmrU family lipid kinase